MCSRQTGGWQSDRLTAGHIVSGHTLKHLAAAAAGYCILRMLQKRRPVSPLPSTISMRPTRKPKLNQSELLIHFTYFPFRISYSTRNGFSVFRSCQPSCAIKRLAWARRSDG